MDLRHARTFVAIAELGTVSRAAEQLRIAQPALSRQLADLEAELGIRLFDRVGRQLMLTVAGEQVLGHCRALLGAAGAIGECARQLQHGDAGVLRVTSSPQFIEGVLAAFLIHYAAAFPKVQVAMTEVMGWAATAARLESGESHLGQNLMGAVPVDDPRFAYRPLEAIDLLAAFGPATGLEPGGAVDIGQLAPHPLLVLDTEYIFRRNFDAACHLADIRPNIAYESRTPHTLLAMAESGHGVAIVPSVLRTDRYRLHVAAIAYRGGLLQERLAIYWNRRRPLPRYAESFCDMLGASMREVFPISRPTRTASH